MKFLYATIIFFITASQPCLPKQHDDISTLPPGYYLVVGAFKVEKNAIRYLTLVNKRGEQAKVGKNPDKDIYYVYVFSSQDLELIKSKWIEYRQQFETSDAWVFKNKMPEQNLTMQEEESHRASGNQVIFQNPSEEVGTPNVEIPPLEDQNGEDEGYRYLFNVVNATTLKEVTGFITVVDEARNKAITSVTTNTPVSIPDPVTQSKEVLFICDIFGYVKQQISLKLDEPLDSGEPNVAVSDDGTAIVNFELQRHRAGDVLTMYHVYFYNDAAIMKPESRYELNSLLDMLKENDNLKIKIHGHTNGNAPGKIIKLRDDDNNFFEVTGNNIDGYGSAKDLSAERSKIIKRWLTEKGISDKRMELKGWGGKKMIYDKKSDQAVKNVRVEIEIVRD